VLIFSEDQAYSGTPDTLGNVIRSTETH